MLAHSCELLAACPFRGQDFPEVVHFGFEPADLCCCLHASLLLLAATLRRQRQSPTINHLSVHTPCREVSPLPSLTKRHLGPRTTTPQTSNPTSPSNHGTRLVSTRPLGDGGTGPFFPTRTLRSSVKVMGAVYKQEPPSCQRSRSIVGCKQGACPKPACGPAGAPARAMGQRPIRDIFRRRVSG